jgi:hypothetical protein
MIPTNCERVISSIGSSASLLPLQDPLISTQKRRRTHERGAPAAECSTPNVPFQPHWDATLVPVFALPEISNNLNGSRILRTGFTLPSESSGSLGTSLPFPWEKEFPPEAEISLGERRRQSSEDG